MTGKLRVSKKHNSLSIALTLYTFYLSTTFFFTGSKINVLHYFTYLILLIISFFALYKKIKNVTEGGVTLEYAIWWPFFILIIYNAINNNLALHYLAIIITSNIVMYMINANTNVFINSIKMLRNFSLFYVLGCFIQLMFPLLHRIIIQLFYSEERVATVLKLATTNQYAGFTPQVGHTGLYIVLGLAIFFYFNVFKKQNRFIYYIIILFLLGGLLLIGKRAHLFFSILSFIIVYYFSGKRDKKITRVASILMIIIILLLLLFILEPFLIQFSSVDRALGFIHEYLETGTISPKMMNYRNVMYDQAIMIYEKYPMHGIGWGNFQQFTGSYTIVHNVYLQLLCETGKIGFVFFLAPLTYSYLSTLANINWINKLNENKKNNLQSFANLSLFAQSFFIMYCFTGNPLYNENYLMTYLFALTINIAITKIRKKK